MGINYVDSVVVYNRYINGLYETEQYFGTRFDNANIEFTEEENQTKAGKENVSVCVMKLMNDSTLAKPYLDPKEWEHLVGDERLENFTINKGSDFFVIVKREGLNLDVQVPTGKIESNDEKYKDYDYNFFEYMKQNYSYVYSVNSFAQRILIPHFQIGGL
ncbi:MAG: hypothetical protein NC321_16045 [Clostridium sp.]|nr:hypothetical protein [Lachnospiraceae bacterium]MCM1254330.1 hypothetical protein [Clostridium sp.]